jgi:hypothetical protein
LPIRAEETGRAGDDQRRQTAISANNQRYLPLQEPIGHSIQTTPSCREEDLSFYSSQLFRPLFMIRRQVYVARTMRTILTQPSLSIALNNLKHWITAFTQSTRCNFPFCLNLLELDLDSQPPTNLALHKTQETRLITTAGFTSTNVHRDTHVTARRSRSNRHPPLQFLTRRSTRRLRRITRIIGQ